MRRRLFFSRLAAAAPIGLAQSARDAATPAFPGLSVRDYGARGDGTSDDTLAFRSWCAELNRQGVPGVIPDGTYLVRSSAAQPAIEILRPEVTLLGSGLKSSTILDRGSGSTIHIATGGKGGVEVEGLHLVAAKTAVHVDHSPECVFGRVWVSSAAGNAWDIRGAVDVSWYSCHTTGGVAGHAIYAGGEAESNVLRVIASRFTGNFYKGANAVSVSAATLVQLTGSIFEGFGVSVLLGAAGKVRAVTVDACYFEAFSNAAVRIGTKGCEGLCVRGCYFYGSSGSVALDLNGTVAETSGNVVAGNTRER